MGVTSRLLDAKDGRQFLTATIGQIYYIDNPRVLLPDQYVDGKLTQIETPRTDNRSDFVAQVAVTAFDNWSGDIGVQWNPQTSETERGEVNVQYKTGGQSVSNVGYRYQRDVLSQAEISSSWPVTDAWNVFVPGRFIRFRITSRWSALPASSTVRAAGNYGSGAAVSSATAPGLRIPDGRLYLQLELTGSRQCVGSESDSCSLTTAIRGYEPADNPIRPNSSLPPGRE